LGKVSKNWVIMEKLWKGGGRNFGENEKICERRKKEKFVYEKKNLRKEKNFVFFVFLN
jgi:hypothetical protein